jgi:hypothetical protein
MEMLAMITVRRSLALLSVVLGVACASGGTSSATPRPDRSTITADEIPLTGTESVYDLIQRLRPEYLRQKPAQGYAGAGGPVAPPVAVVINNQKIGEASDLRQIPASSVSLIRYYNIEEGKRKFGMQYAGGVVELTYRLP